MNSSSAPLRHAILGAGGVGGMMGACLAKCGDAVTMVVRRESLASYPAQIQLESPFGNFSVPVAHAAEVPACDVLWLTVKATQLDAALTAVTDPAAVGAIVPLQNGIDHIARLREKYGAEKVIPATIAGEMERVSAGHFVHRTPFVNLNFAPQGKVLLENTAEQLRGMGFSCRFFEDEVTLMWGKLVFLAPFALTTTAANMTTGEIFADPKWRDLGLGCIREACAVAVAEGAKLDVNAVIANVMKMPGNMRSSMQKDVEHGNPPELDAIAGPILRGASRHGIQVPVTKSLVEAVERRAGVSRRI
jgi:2-dehydropantoate 2-reductase